MKEFASYLKEDLTKGTILEKIVAVGTIALINLTVVEIVLGIAIIASKL